MDARLSPWITLIGLLLVVPLAATPVDDAVAIGRARLFDGTTSGPARACDAFAAGLDKVGANEPIQHRDLLFLHALARTTILLGDENDVVMPNGLLRWVETFSVALATGDTEIPGTSLADWPQANWRRLPETLPGAELDAIVAELESISDEPTPFVLHLNPDETGLRNDLEIDFGDVLMLKSTLLACRACLLEPTTPNNEMGRDERALATAGNWIEQMPSLLGFARDTTSPNEPDTIWAQAVSYYRDAVSYIVAENEPAGSDPQEDELVYIDPASLIAVEVESEEPAQSSSDTGIVAYEVWDANSIPLGELTLTFDNPTGGQTGRLTLADGASLDIDWFGVLEVGEIGISMASPDGATQGWFHGAIAADSATITDATLDLWGAAPRVAKGITARTRTAPTRPLNKLLATTARDDWGI